MLSELVVGYLFCGGAGAGACVLLAALGLLAPRGRVAVACVSATGRRAVAFRAPRAYRRLMAPAFCASFALLAFGIAFLVADLGVPGRALLVFAFPTPTFLTAGAFSLAALAAVSLMLGVAWGAVALRWRHRGVVALHWLALALGVVVVAYTGLLLSSMPAVPFWSNAWLPVLFVASALSCGCAVVMACACLTGSLAAFRTVAARVSRADVALLAVEALALAGLLATGMTGPYAVARDAVLSLVAGSSSALFYGAVVAAGIALPLLLEGFSIAARKGAAPLALVASAAVLAGGLALRYCVVAAGAHPLAWATVS